MKNSFRTIVSFITVALLVLSFSSCTLIEAMQNVMNIEPTIADSPKEEDVVDELNNFLHASIEKAETIKENISYSAGTPQILKDGEKAGTLNAAAKQLKTFIMSAKPGSSSQEVTDVSSTLLKDFEEGKVNNLEFVRNIASEKVTDERGKEITEKTTNKDGEQIEEVVTREYISDNTLHITLNYFDSVDVTDDNGEEATSFAYSEAEKIESIFGEQKDKEAVLKNFESISEYLQVNDYTIEYTNCKVFTDADLETDTLSFIKFEKHMTVTASATGVGSLAQYGEVQVIFDLTKTTNYEFTYPQAEETTIA